MFKKVLVANRGEIAVRIIRGLRKLGIVAVAVYSEPDRDAMHVRMADEAHLIGPAASAQSYLVTERILEAARVSGAEAIHPGYGFLSENADFARAVTESGLAWIGPPPDAIVAMGSKTVAREVMQKAGVPVVPGSPAMDSPQEALTFAQEIGFPVLVKASAGGGGKGMRRVDRAEDFVAAFEGARREALAAFGDGAVFVEKFILQPKHVEIQLLSDQHGNHMHLLERDCSLQRRHQKVIEEAPCPILRPEVRARMGEVATRAAAAVDYVGAGTVEFLLDVNQDFYFLEMNTRLQVEHPVTEMITGLDLVEWQLRIAAGQPLTLEQDKIQPMGVSLECRIYAEDPEENFRPSPGKLLRLRTPSGPWIRDDSGVYEGFEVPVFYDPMISKLVVWGRDRQDAIARMRQALDEYIVQGIKTNIAFHHALLEHPLFVEGKHDTQMIGDHIDELLEATAARGAQGRGRSDGPLSLEEVSLVAAAIAAHQRQQQVASNSQSATGAAGVDPWKMAGRARLLGR
jgi:acetyl-CoA carboxylase biotin carboxylase subunit